MDILRNNWQDDFSMRPYQCDNCGLVFMYPLMSETDEHQFYATQFRELYHGQQYSCDEFHACGKNEAQKRCERLLNLNILSGNILEIGSATGYFLDYANAHANKVLGVEPDNAQRDYANVHGITTVSDISDIGTFQPDVIILFHVLEHIREPVDFLSSLCAKFPRAQLVIEVPNIDDILMSTYRISNYQNYYFHPAHSYYFSSQTLQIAIEQAGYAHVELYPIQRYGLKNHLKWLHSHENNIDSTYFDDIISAETEKNYQKDIRNKNLSDTVMAIASI